MIHHLGRRIVQRQVEDLMNDIVVLYKPDWRECTATGCGFDAKSRSAKNPSCVACEGRGRTAVWATSRIKAIVSWTDVGRPRFGGHVTTGELGDLWFETRLAWHEVLDSIRKSEGAYVLVDDKKLRIVSLDYNRVEGRTSVVARCEIVRE